MSATGFSPVRTLLLFRGIRTRQGWRVKQTVRWTVCSARCEHAKRAQQVRLRRQAKARNPAVSANVRNGLQPGADIVVVSWDSNPTGLAIPLEPGVSAELGVGGPFRARLTKLIAAWRRSRRADMRLGRVSRGARLPEGHRTDSERCPGGTPNRQLGNADFKDAPSSGLHHAGGVVNRYSASSLAPVRSWATTPARRARPPMCRATWPGRA